jgi:succinate-acetate transporter protein
MATPVDVRAPAPLLTESETPPAPPPTNPLLGNPGMVGIPTVIAGAISLGLIDTGYLPATASGAALPIMIMATAIGLLITTVWAAALGQNASASLFAVFFGFYGSYAAFVLGVVHGWYGISATGVTKATEAWLICWLATILLMTLTTLRLPWSFTLLLGLVDVALVLLYLGTSTGDTSWTHLGGAVVFLFIGVAVYLFVDIMDSETGGKGLPLGRPILGG